MATFVLTQEQYSSLVVLARKGAAVESGDKVRDLEQWLALIEKQNGITRDFVLVQWQEAGKPLLVGTLFPEKWPPEQRQSIELVTRPVSKADVEAMLAVKAIEPMVVLCTRDPKGLVGWTPLNDFFQN
jgi:hypothetical protein